MTRTPGKRLMCWLGQDDLWIEEMLSRRVLNSEILGIPSTQSGEIRAILRQVLRADYMRDYGVTEDVEANPTTDARQR